MNTPRVRPGVSSAERVASPRSVVCRFVQRPSCLFWSTQTSVREVGLPQADFFLWNDDFEFTTRLLRDHAGLYCPASVVEHRTQTFGSTDADPGDRFYLRGSQQGVDLHP